MKEEGHRSCRGAERRGRVGIRVGHFFERRSGGRTRVGIRVRVGLENVSWADKVGVRARFTSRELIVATETDGHSRAGQELQ